MPAWQTLAVLARTEKSARRLLSAKGVRFTALLAPASTWEALGIDHPLGDGFRGIVDFMPEAYETAELEAAIDAVPIDLMAGTMLWGTPDTVLAALNDYVDAGMRHLVLQPVSGLVSRRDALYSARAMVSIQRKLRRGGPGAGTR